MLNTDPIEEEVPIDREDLALETQIIFNIYDKLPTKWEGFSGQYLGKDLVLLPILFDEYNIDLSIRKYAWNIIPLIDIFVAEDIAEKIKRRNRTKGDLPSGR